ncbi:MAG: acyl-CoA dehydrogenase [Bacteroidetes bacterium]|nr:acyl-CoA dehydrogenase [Bacteroidota bacterium]
MNFNLTEEQLMIRDTARQFAEEELLPGVIDRDEEEEFPHEQIKKMGELGFMGMMVPEQWGGSGLDAISYVLAMTEISKIDASAAVVMSVNNSLVCWGLNEFGSTLQKEKYLKPLASGQKLGAFALSEPNAGSDASNQATSAVKNGENWIINGAKNWITNGQNADLYLVFASTDKVNKSHGISCFVVEKGAPGFTVLKKERKLGIRGSDTCSLGFTDVVVHQSAMIGKEGDGFRIAMQSLDGGRIGIASQALGIAKGALERALSYSKERKQFGQEISNFQAIQWKLAEMAMQTDAAELLIMRAASMKDEHKKYSRESAMCKLYASRNAVQVALEAIQIHGGYGYVKEYHVERMLRDAKITEIYEGTSEVQHIVIARDLIKNGY